MRPLLPSMLSGDFTALSDPFTSLRRDMQDMFGHLERRLPILGGDGAGATAPVIDIAETKDGIEVQAEIPGVSEKDVSVTLDRNRLTISGEKKQEAERKDRNVYVMERSYGAFQRIIPLDFEPDPKSIDARFEKGLLTITVKKPPELVAKTNGH